jgi:hypothetical protein
VAASGHRLSAEEESGAHLCAAFHVLNGDVPDDAAQNPEVRLRETRVFLAKKYGARTPEGAG